MGVGLPPLEFTECMTDSPYFRENLHKHEQELEQTNIQIKRIIKEVKDLLTAGKQLGTAQRSFANCLDTFTFQSIGGTQTDDEQIICKSLGEFSKLINAVEDERDRMLDGVYSYVVKPLEDFRKKYIGSVKNEKKKFEKQTMKFCQSQERYLNLTTKKQNSLQEADASVDMAERHFYTASMEYVYLIQEVHERKKFEFVETLLTFVFGWLTFYHQGYEVAKDFHPYMADLQQKIQKTRTNFDDYSNKLRKRMADVQKQYLDEPVRNAKGCKEGYLFLLEKKAFGNTWTKHFCKYDRVTKEFSMLPYNQLTTKSLSQPETMVLTSCVRRMSDSIDKRFCFDIQLHSKPGVVFTFQALSEQDRKSWMDIMDGTEPTYTTGTNNNSSSNKFHPQDEQRILDDVGIQFVKRCIEVLDGRGVEEQGIYRIVGVTSKVSKLLTMGLDRRKSSNERLANMDDAHEWETKTITSALKSYLRNLPEPLMTYRYHNGFMAAVKSETRQMRISDVHTLIYRLPKTNFDILKILIRHLAHVASKSDKNLMTVSNLGVCFGPTLLRPEEETVASIMDLKFYNIVVEILIDNYDKIFNYEPPLSSSSASTTITTHEIRTIPSPQHNIINTTTATVNSQILGVGGGDPGQQQMHLYKNGGGGGQISPPGQFYDYMPPPPPTCTNGGGIYGGVQLRNHNQQYQYQQQNRRYNSSNPSMQGFLTTARQSKLVAIPMGGGGPTSPPPPPLNSSYQYAHSLPPTVSSQSETIPNSASSSNESVSSTSRDGGGTTNYSLPPLQPPPAHNITGTTTGIPQKNERSSTILMPYPKGYRSPGNFNTSGRTSPLLTVRRVRTLYACLGEHDGELSFEPNQIITNVKMSREPGWLQGTLNGKTGLIPENYVEMLP